MDNQDGLYWSTNVLQAVDTCPVFRFGSNDTRRSICDDSRLVSSRKAFQIAEKKGNSADVSFIDDDESEDVPDDSQPKSKK